MCIQIMFTLHLNASKLAIKQPESAAALSDRCFHMMRFSLLLLFTITTHSCEACVLQPLSLVCVCVYVCVWGVCVLLQLL